MIRNPGKLAAFERELSRKTPLDPERNFRVMEWMAAEARTMGVFPARDKLSRLPFKIELARRLNVRKASGRPGPIPG